MSSLVFQYFALSKNIWHVTHRHTSSFPRLNVIYTATKQYLSISCVAQSFLASPMRDLLGPVSI